MQTDTTNDKMMQRAAMYVRMSTDHQKYSTENQADAIEDYAQRHHLQIVKTYTDAGKSGLRLDGRDALKKLDCRCAIRPSRLPSNFGAGCHPLGAFSRCR